MLVRNHFISRSKAEHESNTNKFKEGPEAFASGPSCIYRRTKGIQSKTDLVGIGRFHPAPHYHYCYIEMAAKLQEYIGICALKTFPHLIYNQK